MVVSTSVYMLKIIFKINININKLISILRKENIYGACPCIISKLPYRFIITRELYLLTEIFILIETLIKLCLHKQPTEVFYKKKLQACNFVEKRPQHRCFLVNIPKYLRTSLLKNIYERLLLHLI